MSDLSSAISEDSRFSTSDVGLNTNLAKDKLATMSLVTQADILHLPHALVDFCVV